MQAPDALLPTQPQPAIAPPPTPPADPRRRVALVAAAIALPIGTLVGILIGHALGSTAAPPAPPPSDVARLAVTSKPASGNVVVDGRFVGVSPIDRLDLDPGAHTVVIDVFGYQPYAGKLELEPRGKVNLSVLLVPIGARGTTTGDVVGGATVTHVAVPPSALLPSASPPPAASPPPPADKPPVVRRTEAPPPAPSRPRRDCSGEKSSCRDGCSRATSDCNSSCFGCTSCTTDVGWDECHRRCETCRSSCSNNARFCESGCDSAYSSCEASQ